MNTQSALRSSRVSPVDDIVDALAANASNAIASFDALNAPTKFRPHIAAVTSAPSVAANIWLQPAVGSSSRFGKGGIFAAIALVHVIAFYVLTHLPPQIKHAVTQPIEVVMLSELQSKDAPPPPVPLPRLPALDLPVVPVEIEIATPESMSITVTARPAEPVAAAPPATVGTPKTVSSVEYIREPVVKYPQAARVLKQRGTVTLRALIGTEGTAREVDVQTTSGFKLLDDAARTAVLNALFKPYIEGGHALPVYVFIPIEFGLASR